MDERPKAAAAGDLQKTPFAHLLLYVLDRDVAGSLELTAPDGRTAVLTVRKGRAIKGRSVETVVHLGRVLVEHGVITDEVMNRTLLEVAKTKRLHGEVLLQGGHISRAQLDAGLKDQLLRTVHHMFSLPRATTFAFYSNLDLLAQFGGKDVEPVDPYPVIWRAVCEAPPWDHVQATLKQLETKTFRIVPTAALERFEFSQDVRKLIDTLKAKPARLADLSAPGLVSARTAQTLAYCLLITKQLELVSGGDAKRIASTGKMAAVTPPAAAARPAAPAPAPASAVPNAKVETMRTAAAAAPLTAAELEARRKEVIERSASIDKQDYFEMLGIARDATADQVQAAFFDLARKWHPDRLPPALAAVKSDCEHVFARMGEAQATLLDGERRQRYMRLLEEGGATPEEQEEVAAVLDAAANFQKAEVCLRRNDLAQAETLARRAWEGDKQPEYLAMLAWVESLKPENQSPYATTSIIEKLDKAIKMNERGERAYFYRGMLYKRLQDHGAASRDFRKALDLNPRNVEAAREVRLFEMRKGKDSLPPPSTAHQPTQPPKPSGLLGKIFKK